jgi:hypothetical protein
MPLCADLYHVYGAVFAARQNIQRGIFALFIGWVDDKVACLLLAFLYARGNRPIPRDVRGASASDAALTATMSGSSSSSASTVIITCTSLRICCGKSGRMVRSTTRPESIALARAAFAAHKAAAANLPSGVKALFVINGERKIIDVVARAPLMTAVAKHCRVAVAQNHRAVCLLGEVGKLGGQLLLPPTSPSQKSLFAYRINPRF